MEKIRNLKDETVELCPYYMRCVDARVMELDGQSMICQDYKNCGVYVERENRLR